MAKATNYLVVWGNATEQVRIGHGNTAKEAAKDAYGMFASNMTISEPLTLSVIRNNKQRAKELVRLLKRHQRRFEVDTVLKERYEGERVVRACNKELEGLYKMYPALRQL